MYFFFYCRDFLRLGYPLYCQSLEAPSDTKEANDETILEKIHEDKREETQDLNESLKKISDGTPRKVSDIVTPIKVSDIVSRKHSDADSHSNTLTFRDVMLSMIQPSSESGSDVESISDEDEYLIVPKTNIDASSVCTDEENDDNESENEDTPPQPPPRRSKANSARRSFENSLDLDTSLPYGQQYHVTMETSDQQNDGLTAEVDGVDIDTIGGTAQEVSCIDQGEDMVILDVKGEVKETVSESSTEQSPEGKHSETNAETASDNEDDNVQSMETVGCTTSTPLKGAQMNFVDISTRLSHIADSQPDNSDDSSLNQQTCAANEGDDADDNEKDDDGELPCGSQGGGPVSLTRVKCVVSMTTPRDARAHGATDCPSFVEFDMSVDGFGCLFLPAIAPQVSAGKLPFQFIISKSIYPPGWREALREIYVICQWQVCIGKNCGIACFRPSAVFVWYHQLRAWNKLTVPRQEIIKIMIS